MKLMQLNIWQGRLLGQIKELLARENPDVICLQEVYSSVLDTPLLPFFSGLEHIGKVLPDHHVFFSPVSCIEVLGEEVRYGNAILSRWPLTDTETFAINEEYVFAHTQKEMGHNTRNLQPARIQLPDGKELWIINHHGYWEPNPVGSAITIDRMQHVAEITARSSRPLILCGDLNISPTSPAMRPLQDQLTDLTQTYHLQTTLSSLGKVKNVPCDHICVSDSIRVQDFAVSQTVVSDHLALIATLGLE